MKIRVATRRSPLALWQAQHVVDLLQAAHPGIETELVSIDTEADLDLTRSIADIGGKGAFSKEIQALVLAGRADIAVHSAKDLQAVTPPGLAIGAYPERGTVHDCLVGARLNDLAPGAVVATGSNRRRALLLDIRPDLRIEGLRGNIATRLGRLADYDAIVMAAVALERLDQRSHLTDDLDPDTFVPQVGQGALAVEHRDDDTATAELLAAIDHEPTRTTVSAERSFLLELGGDCDLPAGAYATLGSDGKLSIAGVLAPDAPNGADSRVDGATAPDLPGLFRAEVVDLPGADPGRVLAQRLLSGPVQKRDGGSV